MDLQGLWLWAVSGRLVLEGLNFLICEMREKDMMFAESLPAVNSLNLLLSHLKEMTVTEVLVYKTNMFPLQGGGFHTLEYGGIDLNGLSVD